MFAAARFSGVCLLSLGLLAPGGAAHAQVINWTEVGGNSAHTGFNAKETTLSPTTAASLTQTWLQQTGAEIMAAPVVASGRVFVLSTDGTLRAYRATTGAPLWQTVVAAKGAPGGWGISVHNKRVFSNCQLDYDSTPGGGHGGVCAYDVDTGAQLWSQAITNEGPNFPVDSAPYSPPVADDNYVIYGESDTGSFAHVGYLLVLDGATGAEVGGTGNCGDTGFNDCNFVSTAPVAAKDGVVYYNSGAANGGFGYNAFCSFTEATSTTNWCYYSTDTAIAPTVAGELVLFGQGSYLGSTGNSSLVALDKHTGKPVWSTPLTGVTYGWQPPAVAYGLVYLVVGSNGFGTLYAVSQHTGKIVWTYASGGAAGGVASGVTVANGVVYAQCRASGGECAFDAHTGAVLNDFGGGGYTPAQPVVDNGALLTVCGYNNLCKYAP